MSNQVIQSKWKSSDPEYPIDNPICPHHKGLQRNCNSTSMMVVYVTRKKEARRERESHMTDGGSKTDEAIGVELE